MKQTLTSLAGDREFPSASHFQELAGRTQDERLRLLHKEQLPWVKTELTIAALEGRSWISLLKYDEGEVFSTISFSEDFELFISDLAMETRDDMEERAVDATDLEGELGTIPEAERELLLAFFAAGYTLSVNREPSASQRKGSLAYSLNLAFSR